MGLYCNFEFLHLFCFQMKRLLEGVVMTIPKWTVLGMATQTVMRTLWIVKKKTHSSKSEPAFFVIFFFCGGWDQSWLQTYIWATQRSQSTSAPYFPSTPYQCCQYAESYSDLRSQRNSIAVGGEGGVLCYMRQMSYHHSWEGCVLVRTP